MTRSPQAGRRTLAASASRSPVPGCGRAGFLVRVAQDFSRRLARPVPAGRCSRSSAGSGRPAFRTWAPAACSTTTLSDGRRCRAAPWRSVPAQPPRPARLALRGGAPRGQPGGPPADVDEHAGSQNAISCSDDETTAGAPSATSPAQRTPVTDRDHDGAARTSQRSRGAGCVRAQCKGGAEQHKDPRQASSELTASRTAALCSPRSPATSAAARGGAAPAARHEHGQQPQQPRRPVDRLTADQPGEPHAATAISTAAAIPIPASTMAPGHHPSTSRLPHATDGIPGQACASSVRDLDSISRLNRFDPRAQTNGPASRDSGRRTHHERRR